MSMESVNTHRADIPSEEAGIAVCINEKSGQEQSTLAKLTSEAAFSYVLPKLQAAFESIHQPGFSLLDVLAGNVSDLQNAFTDALYVELHDLGVDFSIKMTLRLNRDSRLIVIGEHPHKNAIELLLDSKTELSAAFAEIAAQSAALRDLRSLSIMMARDDAAGSYNAIASTPGENTYQLSLKGDMNHFYFTRT